MGSNKGLDVLPKCTSAEDDEVQEQWECIIPHVQLFSHTVKGIKPTMTLQPLARIMCNTVVITVGAPHLKYS